MKISIFVLGLMIFISACNKDKKASCLLIQMTTNAGPNGYLITYEYDDQRRIKRSTDEYGIAEYQYFKDSVVIVKPSSRTVYYLNSAGLADSSKLRFIGSNPNQLAHDSRYTYNAEGFLIEHREIFSQFYNGSTHKDTSYRLFTILNGNIIKERPFDSSDELNYEYSSYKLENYLTSEGTHPFLGKSSRNLVTKSTLQDGTINATYSYKFDFHGNVTSVSKQLKTGGAYTSNFTYSCN